MTTAEYAFTPSDDPKPMEIPVLTDIRDRLRWIRVFELDDLSLRRLAELLGPGYNDSTIGTWEKKLHMPHNTAAVAQRYREVAKGFDKDISTDWILYGSGLLVTFVTYLDIVDDPQLRLPGIELPPTRNDTELTLVGGQHADRAAS
jgi:hypothetical protein